MELAQKEVGQGTGWSDTIILENAGFKVVQAPLLENLFGMIQFKRFDCFPLGANEAHALLERYRQDCPDVIIEPRLLIRYPFGRLFFVNKNDGELHDMVKTGLITAFNNGSFWKLFRSHGSNAGLFTRANIKDRVQIEISNTNLTEEFKTIPDKYFFSLDMLD